jgi:signal transduction histidine kinase
VNLVFSLSAAACLLGLFFAGFSWFMARAPGLGQLHAFGWSCLTGAAYAACNSVMLAPVSPEVGVWTCRVSMVIAGMHGASWFFYRAAREHRSLSRIERGLVALGVGGALLALIPNALYGEPWEHHIPWLGVTYQDARATTLGELCFAYFAFALCLPFFRSVRALSAGDRTELADTVGMGLLLLAGVNDGLVSSGLSPLPYLLDLGYLLLICSVAASLAARFRATTIRLVEAQAELLKHERLAALGEMSAVVAHEVRNPVAVIFNALATIRKQSPSEAQRAELLEIVEEEAGRLNRMVSNLLEFARPRYVAMSLVDLPKSVSSAVQGASAARAGDQPASPGSIVVRLAEDLPPLQCDPELLRQALMNLISNALQSPGRRGPVVVEAALDTPRNRIELSVIDDGEGVQREDEQRIFHPFFTTRPTGVGLGLPVVMRIAEAHGGELVYRGTAGGGATFTLCLPIGASASAPQS